MQGKKPLSDQGGGGTRKLAVVGIGARLLGSGQQLDVEIDARRHRRGRTRSGAAFAFGDVADPAADDGEEDEHRDRDEDDEQDGEGARAREERVRSPWALDLSTLILLLTGFGIDRESKLRGR